MPLSNGLTLGEDKQMAKTHYWFGTEKDNALILDWLQKNGAVPVGITWSEIAFDRRRDVILHYPEIGPIEYWPDKIDLSGYQGTPRFKSAAIARIRQEEHPRSRQIDGERSATVLLLVPHKMRGAFWTTGELHFTAANMAKTFPELNRINSRFERWLRSNEIVYDNTGRGTFSPFSYNLAGIDGFVKKVFALPEAYQLLQQGAFMADRNTSEGVLDRFVRALELRGVDVAAIKSAREHDLSS